MFRFHKTHYLGSSIEVSQLTSNENVKEKYVAKIRWEVTV
jgi:hypothetical protein